MSEPAWKIKERRRRRELLARLKRQPGEDPSAGFRAMRAKLRGFFARHGMTAGNAHYREQPAVPAKGWLSPAEQRRVERQGRG